MSDLTISVILPVWNGGAMFQRCLAALAESTARPHELIVVDDGSTDDSRRWAKAAGACVLTAERPGSGPALARNHAARHATGDLLFFVDADVQIRPDTLAHIQRAFAEDPGLAALFGSYDDAPGDPGFLSQYKNLQHHYVHQRASVEATTFWSGCGAIRRELFGQFGGFSSRYALPSIEDIELGSALTQAGHRIRLDKSLQVKHLKHWTLPSLLHSDIITRAIPWTRLILRAGQMPNDLNLQTSSRVSVVMVYLGLLCMLIGFVQPWAWLGTVAAAIALLTLNRDVYQFFLEKRGPLFTLGAVVMHWLYYFYSGAAFGVGAGLHLAVLLRFHTLGAQSMWLDEFLQLDEQERAEASFRRALALSDAPEFKAAYADHLRQRGQLEAAATYYLQALEHDRNLVPALVGMSRVYLQRRLPADAAQALERAIQQAPDDYAANYFLAQAYDQLGRAEDATRYRDSAGQIVPDLIEPP